MTPTDLDLLPSSARELADLLGLPALQVLLDWRAGAYFNVPQRFDEQYELCRVLGRDSAELLIEHRRGEQVELPRCAASARAAVWAQIVSRRRAGESEISVAMAYGYTVRGVREVVRRAGDEESRRQGDFGF